MSAHRLCENGFASLMQIQRFLPEFTLSKTEGV